MEPSCAATRDTGAIVFGTVTANADFVVPGATVLVQLFVDSGKLHDSFTQCGGSAIASASASLDANGGYRLELHSTEAAGTRVCIEVSADQHGAFSDVGARRYRAGRIELRPSDGRTPLDSINVTFHFNGPA